MTTIFCDSPPCDNEAAVVLATSVNSYGDTLYNFCPSCRAAFSGGVQHGTFRTVDHIEDKKGHPAPYLFVESTDIYERVLQATNDRFGT